LSSIKVIEHKVTREILLWGHHDSLVKYIIGGRLFL